MTPVAKWLGRNDTGIIDVLGRPIRSWASAALSEFAPAQTFQGVELVSAPFILRAPVFLAEVIGISGAEPARSDPSGGMETKDDKPHERACELTSGEPLVWRPSATRSKRSPSAERGESPLHEL